jgi:hypothetical protein
MRAAFSLAPLPDLEIAVATGTLETRVNDGVSFSSVGFNAAFDLTLASDRSGIDGAPAATSSRETSFAVKRVADHNCVNAQDLNRLGLAIIDFAVLGRSLATAAK